jgi:WD40 repeat protein
MFVLDAHGGYLTSLAFSPDAGTLYAAHTGSGIHVWNLADRTSVPFQIPDAKPNFGMFHVVPGGRWAHGYINWQPHLHRARGVLGFLLLDLTSGTIHECHTNRHACGVAVTSDGAHLLSLEDPTPDKERPRAPSTSLYRLYCRAVTGAGPQYVWHRDYPMRVVAGMVAALGPDRCVEYEVGMPASERPGKRITIRHMAGGEAERVLPLPDQRFDQLLASPDGTKLVARCGTELLVWDPTDWDKPPATVKGMRKGSMYAPAACFHPSAPYLLLANDGPSVLVFDTTTWKQVRKWKWDAGGVLRTVTVSADGTLAAAGGTRGTVVVWDLDL